MLLPFACLPANIAERCLFFSACLRCPQVCSSFSLPLPFCSDSERVKVLPGEKEPEKERGMEGGQGRAGEKEALAATAVKTRQ